MIMTRTGGINGSGGDFPGMPPSLNADGVGKVSGRSLNVQPVHRFEDGLLSGCEATLVRHMDALDDGADGDSLVSNTGWLLQAACHEAVLWNESPHISAAVGRGPFRVMLAVPGQMVRHGILLGEVRTAMLNSGLAADLLELALGEQVLRDPSSETLLALCALRDIGAGLALDQFSRDADSLRVLKRLPLTCIKLAPSLITHLPDSRQARACVGAIISFAHLLDAHVVAMGVDTVDQRSILEDLRCDEAQGRYFGGVMAAEVLAERLLLAGDS